MAALKPRAYVFLLNMTEPAEVARKRNLSGTAGLTRLKELSLRRDFYD
jgi:hypothetical protein